MSWDQAMKRVSPVTCPEDTQGSMEMQKPSTLPADWAVRAFCSCTVGDLEIEWVPALSPR